MYLLKPLIEIVKCQNVQKDAVVSKWWKPQVLVVPMYLFIVTETQNRKLSESCKAKIPLNVSSFSKWMILHTADYLQTN